MLGSQCEQVSIVEMLPQIMKDGEPTPTKYMKERFIKNDVQIYTSTKVKEIGNHTVICEKDEKEMVIEADTVIMAVGVRTDKTLVDTTEEISCKVIKVGDANRVKNGYLGIREGFEAGFLTSFVFMNFRTQH